MESKGKEGQAPSAQAAWRRQKKIIESLTECQILAHGTWRKHSKAPGHYGVSGKDIQGRQRVRSPGLLEWGQKLTYSVRGQHRTQVPWLYVGLPGSGSGGALAIRALSQAHSGLGASAGDWGPFWKASHQELLRGLRQTLFLKDFIYLFLERGEGWEKERE